MVVHMHMRSHAVVRMYASTCVHADVSTCAHMSAHAFLDHKRYQSVSKRDPWYHVCPMVPRAVAVLVASGKNIRGISLANGKQQL